MQTFLAQIKKRLRLIVLGVGVLLITALGIRLSSGPLGVDELKPMIIARLNRTLPHTHASIGHLDLVFFGDARAVGLRLKDVLIRDDRGRVIARAAKVEAALAADSLALAHMAPARLTASDFFIAASVSKEGKYDLGYDAHGSPEAMSGLNSFFYDLTGPEKLGQPISFTRQLILDNGTLRLTQEGSTLDWTAHVATIDFSKLRNRLSAHVRLGIDSGGSHATLNAEASGAVGLKQAAITANIKQLVPAHVFPSVGVTRFLSRINAPVDGLARVDYTKARGFEGGYVDMSAGAGNAAFGHITQTFDGANVTATYNSATHTLVFQKFRLKAHLLDTDLHGAVVISPEDAKAYKDLNIAFDFSGPRVTARLADDFALQTLTDAHFKGNYTPRLRQLRFETGNGKLNGSPLESQGLVYTDEKGQLGADLTAKIKGRFTKDEVFAFWPEDLSHEVRGNLIERIKGGDYANADFVLKAQPGHFSHLENADLRLDFDFQNLGLAIEKKLQNAEGLKGHGTLLGNSFKMDVTGGHLVNVQLTKGGLLVPDFRDHNTKTRIWLESQGDAVDVIEAIDPLTDNQLGTHGLNRDKFAGQSDAHVEISFPTFHDITEKTFQVTFTAHLKDAGLKQAALGWDLTRGDVTVTGDLLADKLEVKGPAQLGPYTGEISYATQFMPKTQLVTFNGSFNAAQFGGSPRVPVPIKGEFTIVHGKGQGKIDSAIYRGDVAWSGDETKKDDSERPTQVNLNGFILSEGMEDQGLPIFEHLKRELPTRISLLRSGEIWSGEIGAESLSGDLAYIEGQRPRLVYKSIITPAEASELGYGALPMFRTSRHLTVNVALDGASKEALIKLDRIDAVLGWSEVAGSDEPLRRLKMMVMPDDWETFGLPRAFFKPKKPLEVTALWQQTPSLMTGHVTLAGQDIVFEMPLHPRMVTTAQGVSIPAPQPIRVPAKDGVVPYELQVRTVVNDKVLDALGYSQSPVRVKGETGLTFSLYNQPGQPEAVLNLDAGNAELGVRATDWTKPVGEAAQFAISFDDQKVGDDQGPNSQSPGGVNLSRITGTGDHVRVEGRASFSDKGDLEFADFSNIYLKDFIDVAFKYFDLPAQNSRVISLSGQQLDLRPWLQASNDGKLPDQTGPDDDAPDATPAGPERPTHVVIDLARLQTSADGAFSQLKLDVNWDGRNGIDGHGSGLTLDNSAMSVNFKSMGAYSTFAFQTDNMGSVVRTAISNRNIQGGRATIDGAYMNGQVDADVRGDHIRVKQIPLLAQLLTVASLQGLNDTLTGDGILFKAFDFPVRYKGDTLFVNDGWAKGQAIGINIWGTTNTKNKAVALSGTLIPAYSINSIFGDVQSNGLGLVGIKYSLAGTLKAPQAYVNPLSVMMPGFMKVWAQGKRTDPIPALKVPVVKDKPKT